MNRAIATITPTLTSVIATVLLVGCGPELDPPSLIERTRVLGAQVKVTGAPDRATPRPGETATVTWLVTGPSAPLAPLSWAFIICPTAGSEPHCTGQPIALVRGHDAPTFKLTVPDEAALAGTRQLAVLGRICAGGEPVIDEAAGMATCTNGVEGTTAGVSIPIEMAGVSNHNPNLGAAALAFAGAPWTTAPPADPNATCADWPGMPQVRAGTKDHVIRLETAGADREDYIAMVGDPPRPTTQREWLQISQFTTKGKLDRAFSSVEAADTRERPAVEMSWEAPAAPDVPTAGLLVRFVFVARDLRGGTDWTERAICVIP